MIAGDRGLGFMLFVSAQEYKTEEVFLSVLVIAIIWMLTDRKGTGAGATRRPRADRHLPRMVVPSGRAWRCEIITTAAVLTIEAYDRHVEQLLETVRRLVQALAQARVAYRVVGGVAVFLHVHERDPGAARSTRDVDIAVDRTQLQAIIDAVRPFGFAYRHAAGVDMLFDARNPGARSAVHLVFVREKVRPEYVEPVPDFSPPAVTQEGVLLAPVADLVHMKLTSYRLKDRVHIQDLDAVGLITPEVEAQLSEVLRARLREVRASE